MPEPLRVLVYSVVDRTEPGGVQSVLDDLVPGLRERGAEVIEVEQSGAPGALRDGCPLFVRQGRRSHHLPSLLRIARILARRRPQVVNVQFVSSEALYFFSLRRLFGYRIVVSAHGSDIMKPDPLSERLLPRLLTKADAVTAVSTGLRERMAGYGVDPERVDLVPNAVDCDFWSPGDTPARSAPVLMAAGRLEEVKGFDLLLDAMARLRRRIPGARLVIAGQGPAEAKLRALAADLGLEDRVEFTGVLDRAALRERFRAADLFILSSRREGMPLALLEAMASGLPVVATSVGGVPEVVTPETGATVPPGSAEALSEAIALLLENPSRREAAAEAVRRRAIEVSRAAAQQSAYVTVLERTAGGRSSRH